MCYVLLYVCFNFHMYFLTDALGSIKDTHGDISFPFFLHEPNCHGREERLIECPNNDIEIIDECFSICTVHCKGKVLKTAHITCTSVPQLLSPHKRFM